MCLSYVQPIRADQNLASWILTPGSHDGAMSTIGSLMSPSNTTSQGSIIHNNESPPAVQEDRYDIRTLTISSILREQLSGSLNFSPTAALMDGIGFSLGPYIECDLKWLNSSIEYSPTYFQKVFPAGWVIITDACIKIKNILYIDFGSANANIAITSQATAFLSKLEWNFNCNGTTR